MKGALFKYDANPKDSELKDNQSACNITNCGIRDPDFWSNDVPVWGICGPYVRASLEKGDILFFLPKKWSWKRAGLLDYICAGILVVKRSLPDVESVLNCSLLTDSYKKNWEEDLKAHLAIDANRTKEIRKKNFIMGAPDRSFWIGRHDNYLSTSLVNIGLEKYVEKISQRKIPYLNHSESQKLYKEIKSHHRHSRTR